MWTRLETQYLQRAADNKHFLHRDFLNLRPTAGEDIMVHITALESMATELNDLGVNITEHDLITTIMYSLPARFGFLASSWDNIPDKERSMDALRARIVCEQRRIDQRHIEEQATIQQRLQKIAHFRPLEYKERHLIATYVGDVDVQVDHAKLLIEIQLNVRTMASPTATNLNAGFGLHNKERNKRHRQNVLTTMTMEV